MDEASPPPAEANGANFDAHYRPTQIIVISAMILVAAILIVSLVKPDFFSGTASPDPTLAIALRISIAMFAIGIIVFRRVRLQPARLRDIHGISGMNGLFGSLKATTVILAAMCEAIAIMGFGLAYYAGDLLSVRFACALALALLAFYAYPRRQVWQRIVGYVQQT